MAHVPEVAILAVNLFRSCGNRNIPVFCIYNRILPRLNVPLAPGSNDLQLGRKRFVGELEADLIVAFAGAAMRDGVRAFGKRHFHLPFREQRPADGCTQQVLTFVHRAGLHEGPEIFSYEFASQVFDVALGCAGPESLFLQSLKLFFLADVADDGDDFTTIVFFEPGNDNRRVQTARVRQNDLLHLLIHDCSPQKKRGLLFPPAAGWRPVETRRNGRIR